ncbi:MAG: hypothetical protein GY953_44410 [bacterium]|nr:hypothetical protein [bacterium]
MPQYNIYRLRESRRSSFRWAPHISGSTSVKPKDYEPDGATEAQSPYAVWAALKETERELTVGDLLEDPAGEISIYKYVGFEQAEWVLPEVATGLEEIPAAAGAAAGD